MVSPFQHVAIWNRAGVDFDAPGLFHGDKALAAMLIAHGLVMNGGVVHALEALTPPERAKAIDGFRYFGLESAASVLAREFDDSEECEVTLDAAYRRAVPSDETLMDALRKAIFRSPNEFAPLSADPPV